MHATCLELSALSPASYFFGHLGNLAEGTPVAGRLAVQPIQGGQFPFQATDGVHEPSELFSVSTDFEFEVVGERPLAETGRLFLVG